MIHEQPVHVVGRQVASISGVYGRKGIVWVEVMSAREALSQQLSIFFNAKVSSEHLNEQFACVLCEIVKSGYASLKIDC
jgi:hypothetical protein